MKAKFVMTEISILKQYLNSNQIIQCWEELKYFEKETEKEIIKETQNDQSS